MKKLLYALMVSLAVAGAMSMTAAVMSGSPAEAEPKSRTCPPDC